MEREDATQPERVDLAHEAEFVLGRLTVIPPHRELVRDDGVREVLEHRVLQVLIALAKARGAVVTRDELTQSCWDGRVVGEDAINRVISRLRKAADGIGAGSFRIETVTKIGYRLVGSEPGAAASNTDAPPNPAAAPLRGRRVSRRGLIAAGALGLAGIAGGAAYFRYVTAPRVSPEVETLMERARQELAQGTPEGQTQGIGLLRRVVTLAPDYAEGWGALGLAYAMRARYRPLADSDALRDRARMAATRALTLDPESSLGQAARVYASPMRGNWIASEEGLRTALADHPQSQWLHGLLGFMLTNVGRFADAMAEYRLVNVYPLPPGAYFDRIAALWSMGEFEEMDQLIADSSALYPTQFGLWFQRFYIWMYGRKTQAAIALANDRESRPAGIPDGEFARIVAAAKAIESQAPAEVDEVMAVNMAAAREGNGYAENAMQFACALGRVDEAFEVADAYYFDRGFAVPDLRFTGSQGAYKPRRERDTYFLFWPPIAPMRADPRFNRLVEEIGLERYWRETGTQPDYRRG